jgi:hypothetical protein
MQMKQILGLEPREIRDTIVDMGYALIEGGFVRKTPQYKGPGGEEERQRYMNLKLSD